MGDELDDLKAVVSEQGLALQGLQQAAEDTEEHHQKSSHHAEEHPQPSVAGGRGCVNVNVVRSEPEGDV